MRIAIRHSTHYTFAQQPVQGLKRLRLMPKTTHGQRVLSWDMDCAGAEVEAEYDDGHSNHTALISIEPGAASVTISCRGLIETADNAGVVGPHVGYMPLWVFLDATALTRPGPKLRSLAARLTGDAADPLAVLHELSVAVADALAYVPGATTVGTTAEEALAAGAGVCQDHAHAFIAAARLLGIPARYVSGYLLLDDRTQQDAGHAWAEAHVPGLGWVGFDISNRISPDERYVRVATGRDYMDAAPVTGVAIGGGQADLRVSLAVEQQTAEQ